MENSCREQLNKNGIYMLNPKGNSMLPFFKSRCKVIVVPKTERLKELDVALYERKDSTLVLHRVVKVLENGYVFIGDGTISTEEILEDAVFGVMIAFIKGKKTIDACDKRYQNKVKRYYSNDKKRNRRIKRLTRRLKVKGRLRETFNKKVK